MTRQEKVLARAHIFSSLSGNALYVWAFILLVTEPASRGRSSDTFYNLSKIFDEDRGLIIVGLFIAGSIMIAAGAILQFLVYRRNEQIEIESTNRLLMCRVVEILEAQARKASSEAPDATAPMESSVTQNNLGASCPVCGHEISEGKKFCPGCGLNLQSNANKSATRTCPICGAKTPIENRCCHHCGYNYTAGNVTSKAYSVTPTANDDGTGFTVACPGCGMKQSTQNAFCINCGAGFEIDYGD